MKINRWQRFLEVNLNLGELNAIRGGKKRGNILVKKLKDHDTISTDNKASTKIDKMKDGDEWVEPEDAIDNITDIDGDYDSEKSKDYLTKKGRYVKSFKDDDGNEIKLNQIKKTKDFGSSGPGRRTRSFESLQCIFMAIKQSNPRITLNSENFEDLYQNFANDENSLYLANNIVVDGDLISQFAKNKKWVNTFCKIPNKLWSRSSYIDRSLQYDIYHIGYEMRKKDTPNIIDSPYALIRSKYKELSKEFGNINIAKYCPADVYLISRNHKSEIMNELGRTSTLDELTNTIDRFFDKKMLIPVSLKMVHGNDFKIIINKEAGKDLPDFFIESFIIGSGMLGIGSKISVTSVWKHHTNDKDVDIKSRILNFDTSNSSKNYNIDGEVEGSSSRHGKISFGVMMKILNSVGESQNRKGLKVRAHQELRDLSIDDLQNEIISIISDLEEAGDIVKHEGFSRGTDISTHKNKLISRLQSLEMIDILYNLYNTDQDIANGIVTRMMRYALSIHTDQFETPRYLRVI